MTYRSTIKGLLIPVLAILLLAIPLIAMIRTHAQQETGEIRFQLNADLTNNIGDTTSKIIACLGNERIELINNNQELVLTRPVGQYNLRIVDVGESYYNFTGYDIPYGGDFCNPSGPIAPAYSLDNVFSQNPHPVLFEEAVTIDSSNPISIDIAGDAMQMGSFMNYNNNTDQEGDVTNDGGELVTLQFNGSDTNVDNGQLNEHYMCLNGELFPVIERTQTIEPGTYTIAPARYPVLDCGFDPINHPEVTITLVPGDTLAVEFDNDFVTPGIYQVSGIEVTLFQENLDTDPVDQPTNPTPVQNPSQDEDTQPLSSNQNVQPAGLDLIRSGGGTGSYVPYVGAVITILGGVFVSIFQPQSNE